jgi:hypothetical protein
MRIFLLGSLTDSILIRIRPEIEGSFQFIGMEISAAGGLKIDTTEGHYHG